MCFIERINGFTTVFKFDYLESVCLPGIILLIRIVCLFLMMHDKTSRLKQSLCFDIFSPHIFFVLFFKNRSFLIYYPPSIHTPCRTRKLFYPISLLCFCEFNQQINE